MENYTLIQPLFNLWTRLGVPHTTANPFRVLLYICSSHTDVLNRIIFLWFWLLYPLGKVLSLLFLWGYCNGYIAQSRQMLDVALEIIRTKNSFLSLTAKDTLLRIAFRK